MCPALPAGQRVGVGWCRRGVRPALALPLGGAPAQRSPPRNQPGGSAPAVAHRAGKTARGRPPLRTWPRREEIRQRQLRARSRRCPRRRRAVHRRRGSVPRVAARFPREPHQLVQPFGRQLHVLTRRRLQPDPAPLAAKQPNDPSATHHVGNRNLVSSPHSHPLLSFNSWAGPQRRSRLRTLRLSRHPPDASRNYPGSYVEIPYTLSCRWVITLVTVRIARPALGAP